mmetsp:Transcript_9/g.20  ORF Transcript_9/g.20 Transcript_9/m.20 type:complete len:818 (+) Transcript_9:123-2576(+)
MAVCNKCRACYGTQSPIIPRILSCGHTFCEGCILKSAESSGSHAIICPRPGCGKPTKLTESVSNLVANWDILASTASVVSQAATIEIEGILRKLSYFRTWQQRYCYISNGSFCVCKTKGKAPTLMIPIATASCRVLTGSKGHFSFEIKSPGSDSPKVFQVEGVQKFQDWVHLLDKGTGSSRLPNPHPPAHHIMDCPQRTPPGYQGQTPPMQLTRVEQAIKWRYRPQQTPQWSCCLVSIRVAPTPFAAGAMRDAFRYTDLSQKPGNQSFIAKFLKVPMESELEYWQDASMQGLAQEWAQRFNSKNVIPTKIGFLNACVLQLIERPGGPLCCGERYIEGDYVKWSNNWDFVDDSRNTPHAFSHYTYHESGGDLVVIDVQGIGNVFTDPQIHTRDMRLSRGDLGPQGIEAFCRSHKCSSLCRALDLPPLGRRPKADDDGTCPVKPRVPLGRLNLTSLDQIPELSELPFPEVNISPNHANLNGGPPDLLDPESCPSCHSPSNHTPNSPLSPSQKVSPSHRSRSPSQNPVSPSHKSGVASRPDSPAHKALAGSPLHKPDLPLLLVPQSPTAQHDSPSNKRDSPSHKQGSPSRRQGSPYLRPCAQGESAQPSPAASLTTPPESPPTVPFSSGEPPPFLLKAPNRKPAWSRPLAVVALATPPKRAPAGGRSSAVPSLSMPASSRTSTESSRERSPRTPSAHSPCESPTLGPTPSLPPRPEGSQQRQAMLLRQLDLNASPRRPALQATGNKTRVSWDLNHSPGTTPAKTMSDPWSLKHSPPVLDLDTRRQRLQFPGAEDLSPATSGPWRPFSNLNVDAGASASSL